VRLLREARAHVGVSAGGVSAAARGARERGELAFGEPERYRGPARERAGLEERRVDGEFFPVVSRGAILTRRVISADLEDRCVEETARRRLDLPGGRARERRGRGGEGARSWGAEVARPPRSLVKRAPRTSEGGVGAVAAVAAAVG